MWRPYPASLVEHVGLRATPRRGQDRRNKAILAQLTVLYGGGGGLLGNFCAPKLPESCSERILFHGSWNLPRIFWEISCGIFSWKLKDENRRSFSPHFRHIFRPCRRNISPAFSLAGLFGRRISAVFHRNTLRCVCATWLRVTVIFDILTQKHFKTVTATATWGNLVQMMFKVVIGNQWK